MKSYVIAIPDHQESQLAADKCIQSSRNFENDFDIVKFEAITPDRLDAMMKKENIKWN